MTLHSRFAAGTDCVCADSGARPTTATGNALSPELALNEGVRTAKSRTIPNTYLLTLLTIKYQNVAEICIDKRVINTDRYLFPSCAAILDGDGLFSITLHD